MIKEHFHLSLQLILITLATPLEIAYPDSITHTLTNQKQPTPSYVLNDVPGLNETNVINL